MAIFSSPPKHWDRFGFKDDPYYVFQLPVDEISRELFVGRDDDRRRLRAFIASYPTGKTMVEGPPGIGKTSLVNVVQQDLYADARRFPLFDVVETPEDVTRESFLLSVTSAVVSSLRQALGEDELKVDEDYERARDTVTRTLRNATNVTLTAGLISGLTLGGSVSPTPTASDPVSVTPQMLIDVLRGLVGVVRRRGFEGLVVPVNNLDTLPLLAVIQFLNLVRDACGSVDGVHWVFIGGTRLFEELETQARRVSESFTSNPIALDALTWPQVEQALERRRTTFAHEPGTPLPVSNAVASLLYEASGGELRFTFARLSRTVLEFSALFPSEREIPDEIAVSLLQEWARGQIAAHPDVTPREREIIDFVRTHGVIRNRDRQAIGVRTSAQMSQLLRSLEAKKYFRSNTVGRAREYRLTAPAALALGPVTASRISPHE